MSIWQIFVKNTDGRSLTITINKSSSEILVSEFKQLVKEKTGIPTHEQRLIFAGKQLEDDCFLDNYPKLGKGATVFLVLRLPGGSSSKPFDKYIERPLPAHLPKSSTVCILCYDDEALLMPCKPVKHSMCSTCLMNYSWNEVDSETKTSINCAICSSEWGLDIVEEYGQATPREIELLAECLSMNVIRSDPNIIECPGCGSYSERQDKKNPRVFCRYCKNKGKRNSEFCWFCLKPWTSSGSSHCGNPACKSAGILAQIESAPMTNVIGVQCPSIRLCPKCGTPIEHTKGCKQMTCKCKTEFCFICLRLRVNGSWQCGNFNTKCTPAPKQTNVPGQK